jgi:hypothetical protein
VCVCVCGLQHIRVDGLLQSADLFHFKGNETLGNSILTSIRIVSYEVFFI